MSSTRASAILLSVLAAALIAACGDSGSEPPGMTRHTLEHDGIGREYFVFLPSSYDATNRYPAAIFMHGYGGTATGTEAEVTNGLTRYADEPLLFKGNDFSRTDVTPALEP